MEEGQLVNRVSNTSFGAVKRLLKRASDQFRRQQFTDCFHSFLIAFQTHSQLSPQSTQLLFNKWKGTFLFTVDAVAKQFEENGDLSQLLATYNQALTVAPNCEDLHHAMSTFFLKHDQVAQSVTCLQECLRINPQFHLAHISLENIKASAIERWHFGMINDLNRNQQFRTAISQAIKKGYGKLVLDIGSGSGLLAMYAAQANCDQVLAVEVNPMMFLIGSDVVAKNGFENRIKMVNKLSTELTVGDDLPERASLIVTEIFDSALFGERCLSTIKHAHEQLLNPDHGLIIPSRGRVFAKAVECPQLRTQFKLDWTRFHDLEVNQGTSSLQQSLNRVIVDSKKFKYSTEKFNCLKNANCLSETIELIKVDFNNLEDLNRVLSATKEVSITINKAGRFDGLVVWWELDLIDDVTIRTDPDHGTDAWEQTIYFPTGLVDCLFEKGQVLKVEIDCRDDVMELNFSRSEPFVNPVREIKIDHQLIRYLNAISLHENVLKSVSKLISPERQFDVINLTNCPLVSLQLANQVNCDQVQIVLVDENHESTIKDFIGLVSNSSTMKKISMSNYEEFEANCDQRSTIKDTILIADFLEPSGLLASNLLEKVLYLQLTKLPNLIVFPNRIQIVGMLIESNQLIKRSRLVSDSNCHELKISKFLNVLETEIIEELNLEQLSYSCLSNHHNLVTINLKPDLGNAISESFVNEPTNEETIKIINNGDVHGIVFWYRLVDISNNQLIVDTRELDSNWKVAAFLFKNPIKVQIDDELRVSTTFSHGFVRIAIKA